MLLQVREDPVQKLVEVFLMIRLKYYFSTNWNSVAKVNEHPISSLVSSGKSEVNATPEACYSSTIGLMQRLGIKFGY